MVELTTAAVIQLVAALSIPAIVVSIAVTQMNTKAKFQWKQGKIALALSIPPLLLILALQGVVNTWVFLVGIGGLLLTILLLRPDQN